MTVLDFLRDFGLIIATLVVMLVLIVWAGIREDNQPNRPAQDEDDFEVDRPSRLEQTQDGSAPRPAARPAARPDARPAARPEARPPARPDARPESDPRPPQTQPPRDRRAR